MSLINLFDKFLTAEANGTKSQIQFVADEHGYRSETVYGQKKQTEQPKPVQNLKPNVSQDTQFDNTLDTASFQVTGYPVSSSGASNNVLPAYVIASSEANNLGLLSAAGLSPLQLGGIASQLSPSLGLLSASPLLGNVVSSAGSILNSQSIHSHPLNIAYDAESLTNSINDEEGSKNKPQQLNGGASFGTFLPFSSKWGNLMSSIAGVVPQFHFHIQCLPASSNTTNEPQKESNQQTTTTEKPTTERTTRGKKVQQTTPKPQDNFRNLRLFYYKK